MIPVYKEQTLAELPEAMQAFARDVEEAINKRRKEGLSASDALNVMANAYAHMGRAVRIKPEALKDLVNECIEHSQKLDPDSFYRDGKLEVP